MYISYSQPSSIKNFKEILNLCTGFKNFSDVPNMTFIRHSLNTRITNGQVFNVAQPLTEVYWFVKARNDLDKRAIVNVHDDSRAGWQHTNLTALAEFPDEVGYKLLISLMELSDKYYIIGDFGSFLDRKQLMDDFSSLADLCNATSEVVSAVVASAKDTILGYDYQLYFFDKERHDREQSGFPLTDDEIISALNPIVKEDRND